MIRPLGEKLPVSVELLTDGPDWQLVSAARNWAEENALSGLTVGCADCDAECTAHWALRPVWVQCWP